MIYDIFNCNWVATRWQQYSTHLHKTVHRTTQLTRTIQLTTRTKQLTRITQLTTEQHN